MNERAFTFGEGTTLLALTSEPTALSSERPAVIILNAGVVHRIGPSRNTVELARKLAESGFLVMRFDLSGIGDSVSRRDGLSMDDNAALDIRQALDHLEAKRGIKQVVLMGLCSGADNAFRVAGEDPRVVGAVLIDGYGYRTPRYYAHYYARRVLGLRTNKGAVRRFGARVVDRARGRLGDLEARLRRSSRAVKAQVEPEPVVVEPVAEWQRPFPTQIEFAREVQKLVDRQVKLLFVYTGGVEQYYNYPGQLVDSLSGVDLRGLVDSEYFANSDHTFSELDNKRGLSELTVRWFSRRFPSPAATPRATASQACG